MPNKYGTGTPGADPTPSPSITTSWGMTALTAQAQSMIAAIQARMRADAARGLPVSNADIETIIRTKYPFMAAFMNHPEIGPILREAARNNWGEPELYGALQPTVWWQTTSQSARQWDLLTAEDPATAAANAASMASTLVNRARRLGLPVDNDQIESLAITAIRNGWTDDQVLDRLLESVNWAGVAGGDLTAYRDRVKQIGAEFLVPVSDATAQNFAVAIASGESSEQAVVSIMQEQARQRFSWMAPLIEQGITPSGYFGPLRDIIARELEVTPDSIDLMDPKWLGMVEVADASGVTRAATMREAQLAARRDPAIVGSSTAGKMLVTAGNAISALMGRRGF